MRILTRQISGYWVLMLLVIVLLLLVTSSASAQQGVEVEPNNECTMAQSFGFIEPPYLVDGLLEGAERDGEIDFMRFDAEPSRDLVVAMKGRTANAGDLADPYLAVLNSNCEVLGINDDYYSLDSYIEFTVPDDGVFILAASSCCDWELIGNGYSRGSYQLTINTPPPSIGSIRVRAIDALSGAPLRGDELPWASFTLYGCSNNICEQWVASQQANADGVVRFTHDYRGSKLTVGDYQLRGYAHDYRETASPVFRVDEAQDYDMGDLAAQPAPVTFSDIKHCEHLLPQGGNCRYEVQINNNTDDVMMGRAWSIVSGYGLGSERGYTSFEATVPVTTMAPPMFSSPEMFSARDSFRRQDVALSAYESAVLTFEFNVPSFIQSGANICAQVYFGFDPSPLFNTAKDVHLFCVQKSAAGFRLLGKAEMKKILGSKETP